MLTFYYRPGTCSVGSHIALEESGVSFTPQATRPEERESYLKINPTGKVPSLSIDGKLLTENTAIQTYAARLNPDAKLLPTQLEDQMQCLSLQAWLASAVHPARSMYRVPSRFSADKAAHPGIIEVGKAQYWNHLKKIDELAAAGGKWLVAGQFTVADGYATVFYNWAIIDELPVSELPAYTALVHRVAERPAARRAMEREGSKILQAA